METKKSYLDELDSWIEMRLRAVNGATEKPDEIIEVFKNDIKNKIRESYFNGRGRRASEKGGIVEEAIRQIKSAKSSK